MDSPDTLPGGSKFFFGVALPLPVLLLCQAALLCARRARQR
jgi:hypothetical protein